MTVDHQESYSIYNPFRDSADKTNPLHEYEPESHEHGWHVSRNLRKSLNHLPLLRRKEEIACELGLHNLQTPSEVYEDNYATLARHQAKEVSTASVIRSLASTRKLSEEAITSRLREYATVSHMEFHPSDICNLSCCGCTYGHDVDSLKPNPTTYPFEEIGGISRFSPASLVITGGGEPTLYRSGSKRFPDLIAEVNRVIPDVQLALVTNGTFLPPGDWPNRFSWIRISLDAATDRTYEDFRGKPYFDQVIQNFLAYLDFDVNYIGLSFLFAQSNVHEYAAVAKFIYDLVVKEKPKSLHKVNIQYRPLRRDPYRFTEPFSEAVTPEAIAQTANEIQELGNSDADIKRFLKYQTNVTAILGGNSHPPQEFHRCYYSQIFHILRANGELRPCFIRVQEPDFALGNGISDCLETIALNSLFVSARRKPLCDSYGCRQCHVNLTLEKGLCGEIAQSQSQEVVRDAMY